MDWPPAVSYAQSADGTHVAYAVAGLTSPDILLAIGMATNLGAAAAHVPALADWQGRLASLGRLVMFDQRGTGRSDPIALNALPSVNHRVEDMEAVLDAAGSSQAIVVAISTACAPALLLAASRPERVQSLVIYGGTARLSKAPDYPTGWDQEALDAFVRWTRRSWGTGAMLEVLAPSKAQDHVFRDQFGVIEKQSVSPAQGEALNRAMLEVDVRDVLPSVRVPTLVLHRRDDQAVDVAHARYIAAQVPDAELVELNGQDHLYIVDAPSIVDEIERFVTGRRGPVVTNRVLMTVVMTDIVGSTEAAVAMGDRRWREVLDQHDAVARRQIDRFGGRLVKTTGDGVLATFDGPTRAVLCATAIRDGVKILGLDIRAGIHCGEVELRDDDIGGIAVHMAARVASLAASDQVLVTRTVRELAAGASITFTQGGTHALKGIGEPVAVFAVDA